MAVKPLGDMIAIQLLEDDDNVNQTPIGGGLENEYDELILAQIVGVGSGYDIDEKKLKKGQVVWVRAYVRDDTKIDDNTILTNAWSVVALQTDG